MAAAESPQKRLRINCSEMSGRDKDLGEKPALQYREREKAANLRMRERIAHQAARIIAEDGLQNYASAKHKAARQIGAPDTHNLPDNDEVERALRDYQAIFQRDEQR